MGKTVKFLIWAFLVLILNGSCESDTKKFCTKVSTGKNNRTKKTCYKEKRTAAKEVSLVIVGLR
jgi:hypothetical protein